MEGSAIIEARGEPLRVVIAGAGVAAIEALLALHVTADGLAATSLLAPDRQFTYRPLWVAEPFGLTEPKHVEIDRIAADSRAHRVRDRLAGVDPGRKEVLTSEGSRLPYDALLVATGARAVEALPGALTFGGTHSVDAFTALLHELERGSIKRLAFVVPLAASWSLPLYELALLTASHLRRHDITDVELTVVTHEASPLALFGRPAGDRVRQLLADSGVALRATTLATGFEGRKLLSAEDRPLATDAVVALPRLEVPDIPGVPQNSRGFIATGPASLVPGLEDVYAAGDASWFPIKQGGIAAQQADAAAAAIAARAGAEVAPPSPDFVLRGALLTGDSVEYLRTDLGDRVDPIAAGAALWWPPGKIAGRYLASYLARGPDTVAATEPLVDLDAYHSVDPEASDAGQREALALALAAADAEADWNDYEYALKWLDVAEQLGVVLPPEYAERRARWRGAAAERT